VVKWFSWFELLLFSILLVFWLLPGHKHMEAIFGLSHGVGFLALCAVMWIACIRREAPYPLLAATLTPAGPFGSVIGIALIEHRGWGVAKEPIPSHG
jgi:hypothetical protein